MIIKITLVTMLILVLGLIWKNSRPIDGIDRKLLEATKRDREIARRLLIRARAKYPHKSQKWYVKKAIDDSNRDRNLNISINNRQTIENYRSEFNIDRTKL